MVSASQKYLVDLEKVQRRTTKTIMGMEQLPYKERQQTSGTVLQGKGVDVVQVGYGTDVGRLTVSWR